MCRELQQRNIRFTCTTVRILRIVSLMICSRAAGPVGSSTCRRIEQRYSRGFCYGFRLAFAQALQQALQVECAGLPMDLLLHPRVDSLRFVLETGEQRP